MTGLSDFHETFYDVERETGLFDLEVDGVPVWERIRFPVYRDIETEVLELGEAHDSIDFDASDYARGLYLWLRNSISRNPFFAGEHDMLVWGHQRRKLEDDGLWWDIYCDPLYDELDVDAVHVEQAYQNQHRTPARTENLRYLDLIEYTGTLLRKSGLVSASVPGEVERQLETAAEEFESRFDVQVDLVDRAEYTLAVRRSTKGLYERLLDRIDPNVAFVVVSYGKETFIECCKEQNVPIVELQHGVIHPQHLGYAYPGDREKEMFPDYLFVFGEFWREAVEYPIRDDHVIPVGYPYLDKQVQKYSTTSSDEQIVFISQGSIGEDLSRFAVELAELDSLDHEIVYKLHPGEYERWETAYPWLAESSLEVVDGDDPPLYQILAESSVQVGVSSTALYEGVAFGLEPIIVDLPGREVMEPMFEAGGAELVETLSELVSAIDDISISPIQTERFFSSDPIEAIDDEIFKLIYRK